MFNFSFQELQVLFLSAIPLTELRLSIPYGIAQGVEPLKAFFLACIGNFIPIAPLLLLLNPINRIIVRIPILNTYFIRLLNKTRAKGDKVEKYGALGLALFVAVPFPGTGIYSGAILAFLFGIRFWYAFISLTIGMVFAGIAVTLASAGAKELASYIYDFEVVVLLLLVFSIGFFIFRKKKHNKA